MRCTWQIQHNTSNRYDPLISMQFCGPNFPNYLSNTFPILVAFFELLVQMLIKAVNSMCGVQCSTFGIRCSVLNAPDSSSFTNPNSFYTHRVYLNKVYHFIQNTEFPNYHLSICEIVSITISIISTNDPINLKSRDFHTREKITAHQFEYLIIHLSISCSNHNVNIETSNIPFGIGRDKCCNLID